MSGTYDLFLLYLWKVEVVKQSKSEITGQDDFNAFFVHFLGRCQALETTDEGVSTLQIAIE